jgi:hypothetical protein
VASPVLSLEQFASIEAWMEAFLKLSLRTPGDNYADLITAVYRSRMRAMLLLTGAKPPYLDKEEEARYRDEIEALVKSAKATGRAPPKAVKLPTTKSVVVDDDDDIA